MKKVFILLLSSLLVLAACGKNYEISDITNKFKKECLSVENLRKMESEYIRIRSIIFYRRR